MSCPRKNAGGGASSASFTSIEPRCASTPGAIESPALPAAGRQGIPATTMRIRPSRNSVQKALVHLRHDQGGPLQRQLQQHRAGAARICPGSTRAAQHLAARGAVIRACASLACAACEAAWVCATCASAAFNSAPPSADAAAWACAACSWACATSSALRRSSKGRLAQKALGHELLVACPVGLRLSQAGLRLRHLGLAADAAGHAQIAQLGLGLQHTRARACWAAACNSACLRRHRIARPVPRPPSTTATDSTRPTTGATHPTRGSVSTRAENLQAATSACAGTCTAGTWGRATVGSAA